MTGGDDTPLETAIESALDAHNATAFVHAGSDCDPTIRYCRPTSARATTATPSTLAVAFDGSDWLSISSDTSADHPAAALASRLSDRLEPGRVLAPANIPHDAALYLEQAGFSLASTSLVDRSRQVKTDAERDHIAAAQAAAASGIERGAAVLASATVADGHLVSDGTTVTADRLRRAIDEGIVATGGSPVGNTTVSTGSGDDVLRPGEPVVVTTAPRVSAGYYGGLARTFVVDSEGGPERRAHVGITQAFRSVQAMLTADTESVTAVEADLEAEIRGFGFGEQPIETRVAGVGLDPTERPREGGDEVGPGSVVRIEAAVEFAPGRWIRLGDVLAKGAVDVEWIAAPSRSIAPTALLDG